MRLAFVSRDLASNHLTGEGAEVFSTAVAMARAGHDVQLVSAELADVWQARLPGEVGLSWHPLAPPRPRHVYFAEAMEYADRVYDTVRALHSAAPLDVVELPDARGEALTLLRAKRLLGEFPGTLLVVALHPTSTVAEHADRPLTLSGEVVRFAERYTRRHADLVVGAGAGALRSAEGDAPARQCVPAAFGPEALLFGASSDSRDARPSAGRTVLWLGQMRPGCGLEVFLQAVTAQAEADPGLRIVVHGADTPTDPLGRSYWRWLCERSPEPVAAALQTEGPITWPHLRRLPSPGTACVIAAGQCTTPGEVLLAMAAGFAVVAPEGGLAAELVRETGLGLVVRDDDAVALADVLAAAPAPPRGSRAALSLRRCYGFTAVARSRAAAYAASRRPLAQPPDPTSDAPVSVVIPVYDQGRYLPAALDSVRHSGVEELEVVVVDDGSTDADTVALLDSWQVSGAVTILRRRHRGLSAARNAGIARAASDLVLVLDSDDMVAPGFLPAAVAALRNRPDLAFVGGNVQYFGLLDMVHVPAGPIGAADLVVHTTLKSMVLYRREALERVGGYDEGLPAFEDWELQLRLTRAGYASDILPLVGQLYRRHAASMSFSSSNAMRSELVQYLVRKHADGLSRVQLTRLVQVLVDLWKTGFEPSRSVLLQRAWADAH